jgi:hypothetical protein
MVRTLTKAAVLIPVCNQMSRIRAQSHTVAFVRSRSPLCQKPTDTRPPSRHTALLRWWRGAELLSTLSSYWLALVGTGVAMQGAKTITCAESVPVPPHLGGARHVCKVLASSLGPVPDDRILSLSLQGCVLLPHHHSSSLIMHGLESSVGS